MHATCNNKGFFISILVLALTFISAQGLNSLIYAHRFLFYSEPLDISKVKVFDFLFWFYCATCKD